MSEQSDNPEGDSETLRRWVALGNAGITVSICFGPIMGNLGWSVQALGPDGSEFDPPFAARDAEHAVEIAEIEATSRGWLSATPDTKEETPGARNYKMVTVIVNGEWHPTDADALSHADVVRMATGLRIANDTDSRVWTVTYQDRAGRTGGVLTPDSDKVIPREGMFFDVADTSRA